MPNYYMLYLLSVLDGVNMLSGISASINFLIAFIFTWVASAASSTRLIDASRGDLRDFTRTWAVRCFCLFLFSAVINAATPERNEVLHAWNRMKELRK